MELETINKLFLELSQFATAKTARELELESRCWSGDAATVLKFMLCDPHTGWGKISSGLTQDLNVNQHSFEVRFSDGSKRHITISVSDIGNVDEDGT